MHYWRIHARVTRRAWSDLSIRMRDAIVADVELEGAAKWFANKVETDTQRLYEDANHWDNDAWTFGHSRYDTMLPLAMAA